MDVLSLWKLRKHSTHFIGPKHVLLNDCNLTLDDIHTDTSTALAPLPWPILTLAVGYFASTDQYTQVL